MKGSTIGYWLLVAVTVALYGAITGWSLPFIRSEAGGLNPFDLSFAGYGFDEAQAFLAALSPEGFARYAGAQGILDALYPPLLFATLSIAIWDLSEGLRKVTRVLMIVVAAIGMGADGFENVRVREMLIAGPDGLTPEMVAQASFLTVMKSAANLVSFALVIVLLIRHLILRRRRSGDGA